MVTAVSVGVSGLTDSCVLLQFCWSIFRSDLNIPRYKVVLQSVIGEVKGQGAYIASRCLWDTETDNYSSFSMKNVSCTATRPPSLPVCRRCLARAMWRSSIIAMRYDLTLRDVLPSLLFPLWMWRCSRRSSAC